MLLLTRGNESFDLITTKSGVRTRLARSVPDVSKIALKDLKNNCEPLATYDTLMLKLTSVPVPAVRSRGDHSFCAPAEARQTV